MYLGSTQETREAFPTVPNRLESLGNTVERRKIVMILAISDVVQFYQDARLRKTQSELHFDSG